MIKKLLLFIALIVFITRTGHAILIEPLFLPIDRLIPNVEGYIAENPDDPHGYYVLGRIHYFAFINRVPFVAGTLAKSGCPPGVAGTERQKDYFAHLRVLEARSRISAEFGYDNFKESSEQERDRYGKALREKYSELVDSGWEPEKIGNRGVREHIDAAYVNLRKALELDPENASYHLALASYIEQSASYLQETIRVSVGKVQGFSRKAIRDEYYKAYELAKPKDREKEVKPIVGLGGLISYEAGKGFIRMVESDKPYRMSLREWWHYFKVKSNLKRFEHLPSGGITPIIFSFEDNAGVDDLIEPQLQVSFDLDGDGTTEQWPWVKPTTGILVWDPANSGCITSGRQLFGTVTWWLFFRNGYQSLDALDNNRDGKLMGRELEGIAVWFDRDSDGISNFEEVIPIQKMDIVSLSTRSDSSDRGMPLNRRGVVLSDGTKVPSYDWITSPFEYLSRNK